MDGSSLLNFFSKFIKTKLRIFKQKILMNKQFAALLIFAGMTLVSNAQNDRKWNAMEQQVKQKLAEQNASFAVAFKDLKTGKTLLINEHQYYHAASTMKTPVLVEVFKQAAAGKFKLTDSIRVKNSFSSIVDGSPFTLDSADDGEKELYSYIGRKRTVYQLAYDMIIASSNLATNIIIELVKAENVMKTMKELGANDIKVLRGVEDSKAFEKGLNNTTTAYDLMLVFEQIAKRKLVSKKACKEMIKILLDQQFNTIIPAQLPANVKVAHKTGSITGIHHDSGIVFLPDGRKYVLVLLSKFEGAEEGPTTTMASVSKIIYDYMMSTR